MDNNNLAREILQRVTALETKMEDVVDNHLASINRKLDKYINRPSWLVVWIMGAMLAIIIALLSI